MPREQRFTKKKLKKRKKNESFALTHTLRSNTLEPSNKQTNSTNCLHYRLLLLDFIGYAQPKSKIHFTWKPENNFLVFTRYNTRTYISLSFISVVYNNRNLENNNLYRFISACVYGKKINN